MKKINISYQPLFDVLRERHITKEKLKDMAAISDSVIRHLNNNENIQMITLAQIMMALNIDDINKIVKITFSNN